MNTQPLPIEPLRATLPAVDPDPAEVLRVFRLLELLERRRRRRTLEHRDHRRRL